MKPNRFPLTLAILVFLVLVAPPGLADQGDAIGPGATPCGEVALIQPR
jgi:hypothetical protein